MRQCPPLASTSPFPKEIPSDLVFFYCPFFQRKTDAKYTGIAESTVSTNLRALFINLPFHDGNHLINEGLNINLSQSYGVEGQSKVSAREAFFDWTLEALHDLL